MSGPCLSSRRVSSTRSDAPRKWRSKSGTYLPTSSFSSSSFYLSTHPPTYPSIQNSKLAVDVGFGYIQSAALGYAFGFGGALMADEVTKKTYARLLGGRAPHMKGMKQAKQFGEFCAVRPPTYLPIHSTHIHSNHPPTHPPTYSNRRLLLLKAFCTSLGASTISGMVS